MSLLCIFSLRRLNFYKHNIFLELNPFDNIFSHKLWVAYIFKKFTQAKPSEETSFNCKTLLLEIMSPLQQSALLDADFLKKNTYSITRPCSRPAR